MSELPPAINVRMLGPGDEGLLDAVAPDVFDNEIDARAAREFLSDPRHRLAVAIDGDVVVGFVSAVLYVHPDKPAPELWINEVGVAASHLRRGIARRLMEATLDDARDAGCSEAWVITDQVNQAAMRLYASAGGEPSDGHVMFTFRLGPDRGKSM